MSADEITARARAAVLTDDQRRDALAQIDMRRAELLGELEQLDAIAEGHAQAIAANARAVALGLDVKP